MMSIDLVWSRVRDSAGQKFRTISGLTFTYGVEADVVHVVGGKRNLHKTNFRRALERMPASGPGQLHDLQGPSYVWAILMDERVRQGDW